MPSATLFDSASRTRRWDEWSSLGNAHDTLAALQADRRSAFRDITVHLTAEAIANGFCAVLLEQFRYP